MFLISHRSCSYRSTVSSFIVASLIFHLHKKLLPHPSPIAPPSTPSPEFPPLPAKIVFMPNYCECRPNRLVFVDITFIIIISRSRRVFSLSSSAVLSIPFILFLSCLPLIALSAPLSLFPCLFSSTEMEQPRMGSRTSLLKYFHTNLKRIKLSILRKDFPLTLTFNQDSSSLVQNQPPFTPSTPSSQQKQQNPLHYPPSHST